MTDRDETMMDCPMCDWGEVDLWVNGEVVDTMLCPYCHGTGRVPRDIGIKLEESQEAMRKAMAGAEL